MKSISEEKLRQFLNLTWLRPEVSLFQVFRSDALRHVKFLSPSLDISCGDGLTMFVHLGGILDVNFDCFQSTRAKEFKHLSFKDIYDVYDKKKYNVKIVKKPKVKIDYGTDWKQSLLDKASKIGLYRKLLLHDNNKIPLPFPNSCFKTIFSNSIYWVKNVEDLLLDIHRITRSDGVVVIQVMTPYLFDTLDRLAPHIGGKALAILGRKRRQTMPGGQHSYKEWSRIILKSGFCIENAWNTIPSKLVIDVWNVGLRPVAHLLIQMSEALSNTERQRIKKEWVDIFFELLKPFLSLKDTYSMERAPYVSFKLVKK